MGEATMPMETSEPSSYNSPGSMVVVAPFYNTVIGKDCIAQIYSHYNDGTWIIESASIFYFDDKYIYYCGNVSLEDSDNMKLDKQLRFPRMIEAGTSMQASFTGEGGTYTGTYSTGLYEVNQTFASELLPSGESDLTDCITTVSSSTVTHDDLTELCMDIDLMSGGKGTIQNTEYSKEIDGSGMTTKVQSCLKVLAWGTGWPSSTDLSFTSVLTTLQSADLPSSIQNVEASGSSRVVVIPMGD